MCCNGADVTGSSQSEIGSLVDAILHHFPVGKPSQMVMQSAHFRVIITIFIIPIQFRSR